MDSSIVFALVIAALFFGCICWLVIYSRKQDRKRTIESGIKPPDSHTENPEA